MSRINRTKKVPKQRVKITRRYEIRVRFIKRDALLSYIEDKIKQNRNVIQLGENHPANTQYEFQCAEIELEALKVIRKKIIYMEVHNFFIKE